MAGTVSTRSCYINLYGANIFLAFLASGGEPMGFWTLRSLLPTFVNAQVRYPSGATGGSPGCDVKSRAGNVPPDRPTAVCR